MAPTGTSHPQVNTVVLCGEITDDPTHRCLPSGASVVHFDVRTRLGDGKRSRTISSPVAVVDPSAALAAVLVAGEQVVVTGTVTRRFFRVGGATQSRTEVVADVVVPFRRRKQVERAIDAAIGHLAAVTDP